MRNPISCSRQRTVNTFVIPNALCSNHTRYPTYGQCLGVSNRACINTTDMLSDVIVMLSDVIVVCVGQAEAGAAGGAAAPAGARPASGRWRRGDDRRQRRRGDGGATHSAAARAGAAHTAAAARATAEDARSVSGSVPHTHTFR